MPLSPAKSESDRLERDEFRLRQQRRAITSPSPRSSRGEGWGEGLLPQIPNISVRGDSPSPGLHRTMLRIAEAIRPLPASGARQKSHGLMVMLVASPGVRIGSA